VFLMKTNIHMKKRKCTALHISLLTRNRFFTNIAKKYDLLMILRIGLVFKGPANALEHL